MAEIIHGLNDAEDVQRWSNKLMREAIPLVMSQAWASEGDTTPLHVKTELQKGAGSTVKFSLRVKATGAGVKGDNELEGSEEGMTTYQETMIIDQLRHAFKTGGRMSEQRVTWRDREEIKDLAVDWWSERLEKTFFNLACGYTIESDDRYTGLNGVATAPTNHLWTQTSGTNTADENLDSTDKFDLPIVDKAVNWAKIMSPQIRPVKVEGGEYYIVVLHPDQVHDLRDSNSVWFGHMRAAMQGGSLANNPLFTGALGASNGCVFYESNYISNGINSSTSAAIASVKRAVLLGAQSICMAFGKEYSQGRFKWVERPIDYDNKLGVASGLIFGMLKPKFNSRDYGVIVMSSYGIDPS